MKFVLVFNYSTVGYNGDLRQKPANAYLKGVILFECSMFLCVILSSILVLKGGIKEEGKYKHTVDLPKTTFGMRANAVVREPEIQKLWEENQVFKRVSDRNTGVSYFY